MDGRARRVYPSSSNSTSNDAPSANYLGRGGDWETHTSTRPLLDLLSCVGPTERKIYLDLGAFFPTRAEIVDFLSEFFLMSECWDSKITGAQSSGG